MKVDETRAGHQSRSRPQPYIHPVRFSIDGPAVNYPPVVRAGCLPRNPNAARGQAGGLCLMRMAGECLTGIIIRQPRHSTGTARPCGRRLRRSPVPRWLSGCRGPVPSLSRSLHSSGPGCIISTSGLALESRASLTCQRRMYSRDAGEETAALPFRLEAKGHHDVRTDPQRGRGRSRTPRSTPGQGHRRRVQRKFPPRNREASASERSRQHYTEPPFLRIPRYPDRATRLCRTSPTT